MRTRLWLLAPVVHLAAGLAAPAADPVRHRIMFAEYGKGPNRLVELDPDGKVAWEYALPGISVIFQPLAGGRVLYAHGGTPTGVAEVDRAKKVVWRYESTCPQVLGCERLPNGNTLVAEQGPCRAVEVDPAGKVVRATPLTTSEKGYHLQVRNVHKLAGGNVLAAHEGEGAVREYDPAGKVVWEYAKVDNTGEALRLANGNTLVAGATQRRVIEVTPAGKVVWEFSARDAPELNLTWVSSLQVLRNGNYVVGNFLRGQEGTGAHAFEVTRDKKVVWTFADHKAAASVTTVRVLDDK
jgi:outer membrane protein assembly factor BamB